MNAQENAGRDKTQSNRKHNLAGDRLRSYIERVERLEEEKAALAADIKLVYAEAKAGGFDVKVMRRLIRDRKQDPVDLAESESLLAVYRDSLLDGTPLGDAARALGKGRAAG